MVATDIAYPKQDIVIHSLQGAQHAQIQKNVERFGSGSVKMDVYIDKMACKPGEGLQVTVEINNQSTSSVALKYILYRIQSRISPTNSTVVIFPLLEINAKAVHSQSKDNITKLITIPRGTPPSISSNSPVEILYALKVCLDICGSSFLYLHLPIFILPDSLYYVKRQHQQQLLDASKSVVAEYSKPNQQTQRAGKRPTKPRSIDNPPNY
ncbi:arrestin domain-containing protein 3-like [Stigmatopora argus]